MRDGRDSGGGRSNEPLRKEVACGLVSFHDFVRVRLPRSLRNTVSTPLLSPSVSSVGLVLGFAQSVVGINVHTEVHL